MLALPGMRGLTVLGLLARIPGVSTGVVLTLHVVLGLERGYAAAGLVGAAFTVGVAVGAPLLGRVVDRYGLRRMLVVTMASQAVFWTTVPWLDYPMLLVAAPAGGLLALPVFSVIRQAVAAAVPPEQRRAAYSLDSISVEVAFMVGPAFGVLVATQVSTTAALGTVGGLIVAAGVALFVFDPKVKSGEPDPDTAGRPARSRAGAGRWWPDWLSLRLIMVLGATTCAAMVLAGTDVAVIATLQRSGEVSWTGAVFLAWSVSSMAGGFVYGAQSRSLHPLTLTCLLGALTIPIGVAGSWWALSLAILPAGLLCAPTITAATDAVSQLAPERVRGLDRKSVV